MRVSVSKKLICPNKLPPSTRLAKRSAKKLAKKLARAACIAGVLLALPGCDVNALNAAEDQSVRFSPFQTRQVTPRIVKDPAAAADGGVDEIKNIVTQLANSLDQAAEKGGPAALNMAELEAQFVQRGRYLDLVGIYQNMLSDKKNSPVDTSEFSDAVSQRLISAYIDLGQQHLARKALDELIQSHPDDPMTWLLNASFFAPAAPNSVDAAARVAANWQKALQIDPEFSLPDQSDRPLRAQLDELRRFVPEDKIAAAVAELHEQMNAQAVDKKDAPDHPDTPETQPHMVPGTIEVAQNSDQNQPKNTVPGTMEIAQNSDQNQPKNTVPGTMEVAQNSDQNQPKNTVPGTTKTPPEQDNSSAKAGGNKASEGAKNATSPKTTADPKNTDNPKKMRIPYLIAHGKIALAQQQIAQAEVFFKEVISREPEHFEANFGLIQAGWRDESRRNALLGDIHKLANRKDLTPRQQIDLGKFVYFNLKDNQLALKLWSDARKRDPKAGKSQGLDALIEDASKAKAD